MVLYLEDAEHVYHVVDVIDVIAKQTGKSVPQIALNWLLQRPTVSNEIFGARNEEQLRRISGAADWKLTVRAGRRSWPRLGAR